MIHQQWALIHRSTLRKHMFYIISWNKSVTWRLDKSISALLAQELALYFHNSTNFCKTSRDYSVSLQPSSNMAASGLGSIYMGSTEYLFSQISGHLGIVSTRGQLTDLKLGHSGKQIFGHLIKWPSLELGQSSSWMALCEQLWPANYLHGTTKRVSIRNWETFHIW